jgi:3-oxoacyl-[acyl-carrier protein] reductase
VGGLEGKLALVTGASRGYGRAIAQRLARDGAVVAAHYATNDKAMKTTLASIKAGGGRAFPVKANLDGSLGTIDTLFKSFDQGAKKLELPTTIDILVNNAAICLRGSVEETTEAIFDDVFNVNVKAPFFLVKEALKRIPDGGRIVNISSQTSLVAFPGIAAYSMTKGAIDLMTLVLAKQLGPRQITVNALLPGAADTDMNADWLPGNAAGIAYVNSISALGRMCDVTDIADIVGFLASHDGRWITGQKIDAAGGSQL